MALFGRKTTYVVELVGGPRDGEEIFAEDGRPSMRMGSVRSVTPATIAAGAAREVVYLRRPGQPSDSSRLFYDFFAYTG